MKTVLTGIKPTGNPHVGNFGGMIQPALELIREHAGQRNVLFIADLHALNVVRDRATLRRHTHEVAAALLACGLDPEGTLFFRQSDVRETAELSTVLAAYAAKGLMNRAHAYKAAVDANRRNGLGPDDGANMGLFTYPVLMAADILLYDSDLVPVGKDQVQHVEITRDIALAFNRAHGEVLRLPEARLRPGAETIPGLDGRKMSKSYGNTIPLFDELKAVKKAVMAIVTDTKAPGEPKDAAASTIVQLHRFFAAPDEHGDFARRFAAGGMGYGDAKKTLLAAMEARLAGPRERFRHFMDHPGEIDALLAAGAARARKIAAATMARVRGAVGL